MFNLTDRKETKFLVSIQLIKGGNQNVKKKVYFQSPIISFTYSRKGMSMFLNHPAHKSLSSAGKVLRMRETK